MKGDDAGLQYKWEINRKKWTGQVDFFVADTFQPVYFRGLYHSVVQVYKKILKDK
jgi:hypothetical protein